MFTSSVKDYRIIGIAEDTYTIKEEIPPIRDREHRNLEILEGNVISKHKALGHQIILCSLQKKWIFQILC